MVVLAGHCARLEEVEVFFLVILILILGGICHLVEVGIYPENRICEVDMYRLLLAEILIVGVHIDHRVLISTLSDDDNLHGPYHPIHA